MTEIDVYQKFLENAAAYFGSRPTGGEDRAHWSNVFNAQNCREIAAALSAQASRVAELEGALERIGSQAICYGMTADESELRDWLKNISDIAESAIGREDGNQS